MKSVLFWRSDAFLCSDGCQPFLLRDTVK